MTSKVCTKCKAKLPLSAFGKDAQKRDGLCSHCGVCRLATSRTARGITPDRYFAYAKKYANAAEKSRAWKAANPEKYAASVATRDQSKLKAAHKKWRDANVERERARTAQWAKDNPAKAAALAASRRARMRGAAPAWADKAAISAIYSAAKQASDSTGVPHEVDHIVPLKSPVVCGLHVPANLRVITASANAAKGNRAWPDMPRGD